MKLFGNRSGNAKNKVVPPLNPWATVDDNDSNKAPQNNGNASNGNGNGGETPDPARAMRQFMEEQGLFANLDGAKLQEAVANRDIGEVTKFFQTTMADTVRVAMLGAQRIGNASEARAVERASERAISKTTRDTGLRLLNDKLPFTAAPATAPVAEGVFDAFMEKGESMTSAVEKTAQYFAEQARTIGSHYGMIEKPANDSQSGRRGFSASSAPSNNQNYNTGDRGDNRGDDDPLNDFVAALTGGNTTFDELNAPQRVHVVNNDDGNDDDGN